MTCSKDILKSVTRDEYRELIENTNVPLWAGTATISCYPSLEYLALFRGETLLATWALPISKNGKNVGRICRLLPYHSPVIYAEGNLRCRSILVHFFEYLMVKYDSISLPFDPQFLDLSVLAAYRTLIEWRHTHIANLEWLESERPSKIRNHYNYATSRGTISSINAKNFCFEKAIVTNNMEALNLRKKMALSLYENQSAFCLRMEHKGVVQGEVFVALDENCGYLLHTWYHKKGLRGVPSALIISAIVETLVHEKKIRFDLEGSVLPSVDTFFSGFEFEIRPYAHIHWNRDSGRLMQQVDSEVFSPDRLFTQS